MDAVTLLNNVSVQELRDMFVEYKISTDNWLKNNKPKPLKSFSDYEHKDTWGTEYRDAIMYMEELAFMKSEFNGIKHLVLDKNKEINVRIKTTEADKLLLEVEHSLWSMEEHLKTARTRIDFFKTISYVVGNFTWGMG